MSKPTCCMTIEEIIKSLDETVSQLYSEIKALQRKLKEERKGKETEN